ncbi:MAG: hypothetical protein ABJN69_00950 [Hellea sp.]
MKRVILPLSLSIGFLAVSGMALAHPHEDVAKTEKPKTDWTWPYFGKKAEGPKSVDTDKTMSGSEFADRLESRFEKHSEKLERALKEAENKNDFMKGDREIKSGEDLREAARAIEDVISESGLISGLADMMLELAEDFDVETTDGGVSLKFDGERIGRVKVKRDKHTESAFDVEGFGRNMTVEKEVIKRNGKTKTRIVIEVDGDEEFDIDFKPKN